LIYRCLQQPKKSRDNTILLSLTKNRVKKMSDKLLPIADVMRELNIGRTSVYNLVNKGLLAKPIKVGRSSKWLESEINESIAKMKLARGAAFIGDDRDTDQDEAEAA
jgi:predicted DNA-binding transcriptional regulator AlpA